MFFRDGAWVVWIVVACEWMTGGCGSRLDLDLTGFEFNLNET